MISKKDDVKIVETDLSRELEEMAAKLLKAARKLPPGSERHGILKEIGKFRTRIHALKAKRK